jgi:DNA-directed RNA polymerase subunit RPC12/RpoP
MKYRSWVRLPGDVRQAIVDLADRQSYKCTHCEQNRSLEIEHDHEPEYGPGYPYTIYNIRGLACRGCNWQIMMYEKEERGEFTEWANFSCYISMIATSSLIKVG